MKNYINKVKHTPANRYQRVVTDMTKIKSDPLNMIGMNIPSIYGGILKEKYWESRHNAQLNDKNKMLRCSGIDVHGWDLSELSSAGEEDDRYAQRYDDDKMELMGATDAVNFSLFRMSQFGQARSPFTIDFREDLESEIYFAVDGEFFVIRNAKKIEFRVDPHMPRIKLLRFNPDSLPPEQ